MEQLKPYLDKAKVLLDHLEKIILLGVLGALGYFAVTKMLARNTDVEDILKQVPTEKKVIQPGGPMVQEEEVRELHASINAATNTNKTPRLKLLKGISNHFLFSPEEWLTNSSLGIFLADDGERKRGIEALSVAGRPYSLNMRIWAEVRLNPSGSIIGHYLTVTDEYFRYQTTNALLYQAPQLHPFLPTTNMIVVGSGQGGQPTLRASSVPMHPDWLNVTNIMRAGVTNVLHTNYLQRTYDLVPDKFENTILKHINEASLAQRENWAAQIGASDPPYYATMTDPLCHPERMVAHFYEVTGQRGSRDHAFKLRLYLYPSNRVIHFGDGKTPPLPAYVLRPGQKEGACVNFAPQLGYTIPRGDFIDLEYGRGTNHRFLIPACRPGRKLFIDGQVYIVEAVTTTHVHLGKDPLLTPQTDPTRDRKYRLPIPGMGGG